MGPTVRTPKRSFLHAAYPAFALLLACLGSLTDVQAATRSATLEAIHKLENPGNSPKPGKHGELRAL